MLQILQFFESMNEAYFEAEEKHPGWPKSPALGASILSEEVGKLTRVANDVTFGARTLSEARNDLQKYAARVGAMARRFSEGVE